MCTCVCVLISLRLCVLMLWLAGAGSVNINYINESVISVAVMRRKHTRTRPTGRGQCGKDVCCVCAKLLRVHRGGTGKWLANECDKCGDFLWHAPPNERIIHTFKPESQTSFPRGQPLRSHPRYFSLPCFLPSPPPSSLLRRETGDLE